MRVTESSRRPGIRFAGVLCALAFLAWFVAPGEVRAQDCVGFLERIVEPGGTNGAFAVHAADLDGDGDVDFVVGSIVDDTISWFENDGAAEPSFIQRKITDRADGVTSVSIADLDADGDPDVLSASPNSDSVRWYENLDTVPPSFVPRLIAVDAEFPVSVHAADGSLAPDPAAPARTDLDAVSYTHLRAHET